MSLKQMFRHSIKAKLIGINIAMFLGIICILVIALAQHSTRVLTKESQRQLSQSLEQNIQLLSSFMETRTANIDLWASSPLIKTFLENPAMSLLFTSTLQEYFADIKQKETWIEHFLLLQHDSIVYADSEKFVDAPPEGITYLLSLAPDSMTVLPANSFLADQHNNVMLMKRRLVYENTPIEGSFILVLLDLDAINTHLFQKIRIGNRGFLSIIATRSSESIVIPRNGTPGIESRDFRETSAQWTRLADIPANYKSVILQYRVLPDAPLAVVGAASLNDVRQPVFQLIYMSIMFGILVSGVGILGAIILSAKLTAPILLLTKSSNQLAHGNLEYEIDTSREDELGMLAKSFAQMRDAIRNQISELQKLNQQIETQNEALRVEVTERKRAQDALQVLNEELEDRVKERTRQLEEAHAQIVKLEKEALEIRMAGGFAHEMRNALVGAVAALHTTKVDDTTLCQKNSELLGLLFRAIEASLPEERWDDVIGYFKTIDHNEGALHEVIEVVNRCISRAMKVTGLILDYARLGRPESGAEEVDLGEIVATIVQEHQSTFAEQQIGFQVARPAPQTTFTSLTGSPMHFHSMLNNLILNARDALLEVNDGRERRIEIRIDDQAAAQIVTISDNANGILPENLVKIYEPFFSTKPTTGTGLGLSFTHKLVQMYHGTIDVQSEVGKGTTFMLTFLKQGSKE